jgi:hypothetical protein
VKLTDALADLGRDKSIELAERMAKNLDIQWNDGVAIVFKAIVSNPDRVPRNIGSNSDSKNDAISKWLKRYEGGKNGRASRRVSNLPGTVPDPIIEKIIGAKTVALTEKDLEKISHAHRLSMSAENILGLILEEYLASNLEPHGWYCAWGETVRSVDFVHEDGRLLQIKNRSNSENSSSSAVRNGAQIEKWFRIKAAKIEYMWESLNTICGSSTLSEESFVAFVETTLTANPACLAIEVDNPWI